MQARDRKISVPNVPNDSEAAAEFATEHSLPVTAHLFQAEIPKAADVRVTVVGEQVFAQRVTFPDGAPMRPGRAGARARGGTRAVQAAPHSYLTGFSLAFGCFDFALTDPGKGPAEWAFSECEELRKRIETELSAYDEAGRPRTETFTPHVYGGGHHLRHPRVPGLPLPRP